MDIVVEKRVKIKNSPPVQRHGGKSRVKILEVGYDPASEATTIAKLTFGKEKKGLAGSIAYLNGGAELYNQFMDAHSDSNHETDAARLMRLHGSHFAKGMEDIERLIVIGGGGYNSFSKQELQLVTELYAEDNAKLKEIILIDVSKAFLEEQIDAIQVFETDMCVASTENVSYKIVPIRADFNKISGIKFDEILEQQGLKPRKDVHAAVIMTGATFGNIVDPSTTDSVPTNDIEKQMATIGEFVSNGSYVMFDHFKDLSEGENYYNTPELAAFFEHIPVTIQNNAPTLDNFKVNDDDLEEEDKAWTYKPKANFKARLVEHRLVSGRQQLPSIVNGSGNLRILPIDIGDEFAMMYSLRPRSQDIEDRPSANTGLKRSFSISEDKLVMHKYVKVGVPSVLDNGPKMG